ncbi:MAG TPA: class I fructose-bisphosphate aldolase [Acidobacteriota bacterium]|nr:class I fructose-bisphosphate aldolase [Acidobacteriota bacterium]
MAWNSLEEVAQAMVAPGKGILAADESTGTIKKRFDSINTQSTEENRRSYRELLITTAEMEKYISGVIMFDETVRQSTQDGKRFVDELTDKGVIPGIKVDKGAKDLPFAPGEKVTEGLDGLRQRVKEYREMGLRFAKWRAVITIGEGIPSSYCIRANAHALARYAALCVEGGLVPIVEPEVLMDGDHTIERCSEVTHKTLYATFQELAAQRVPFEQILLKPNMVLSGSECSRQAGVEEVARATVECFLRTVPAALPGVVFLSGGQSDELATQHLNAMNRIYKGQLPWKLSFSYGRALQAPALQAWNGQASKVQSAKDAFQHRAQLNGAATLGQYTEDMEKTPA